MDRETDAIELVQATVTFAKIILELPDLTSPNAYKRLLEAFCTDLIQMGKDRGFYGE